MTKIDVKKNTPLKTGHTVHITSNINELTELLKKASGQAESLQATIDDINKFKLKIEF